MDEVKPKKKFNLFSRLFAKINSFFKKFDIQKAHFESLSSTEKKAINIAKFCIQNKNSKLYRHSKTGFVQIELPQIFITIEQTHGFYEVDFVFINQPLPTSDKIIFDSSGVLHILQEFDKEVDERMIENLSRKNDVVDNHLDNLFAVTENLTK